MLATGRDQETVKWEKKRNSSPKQNTHDLLVGTLSIGIPSITLLARLNINMWLLTYRINVSDAAFIRGWLF